MLRVPPRPPWENPLNFDQCFMLWFYAVAAIVINLVFLLEKDARNWANSIAFYLGRKP